MSDFRADHGDLLDDLLTQSVAALMAEGIVELEEVVQDGTKVRAAKVRKTYETLQAEKAKAAKTNKAAEEKQSGRQVSKTDPEARMMKFADQSYAPGFNIQLAASGLFVVGLEVTQRHNDMGLAAPMIAQLEERYDQVPERLVVDSRIETHEEIIESRRSTG